MEPKPLSELTPSNLQTLWPVRQELQNEISIYKGELTNKCLIDSVVIIKKAFPTLPLGFYDIFTDRIRACGFSDDRLRDSVNHVIDNCIYPAPTIAQFLSWDKRIKVLTFEDMIKKVNELGGDANAGKLFTSQYAKVKFPEREKSVWVHVDDVKMYNIKIEESK